MLACASLVLRWTFAIATAALALFLRPAHAVLADPASCGGLVDALLALAARLGSETPLVNMLTFVNAVAVVAAWLAFWWLAQRLSGSSLAATVVTASFAFSPLFDRIAAPTPAIVVLMVALAALAIRRDARPDIADSIAVARLSVVALAIAALTIPRLTLPAAIVALALPATAAGSDGRSIARRIAFVLITIAAGVTGAALVPDLPRPSLEGRELLFPCVLPAAATRVNALTGVVGTVVLQVGPVPLVAALVGVFQLRRFFRSRAGAALSIAGLVAACSSGDADSTTTASIASALAGVWCLAACGVSEMVAALRETPGRRLAGWLFAAMIPLLQFSRADGNEPEESDRFRGHETLSAASMSRILSTTPTGAVLIVDDAITDLLARGAAHTPRIATRSVLFASRQSGAELARPSQRVLVMPRAQFILAHSGFDLRTELQPRVPGVAVLGAYTPCHEITTGWSSATTLQNATRIAAVAGAPELHGPAVIYLGLGEWSEPRPLDWPEPARRGLTGRTYDRGRPADALEVDRLRQRDQAPDASDVFSAPIVVRLELWRAADGPSILPIDIGATIRGAITRRRVDPPSQPLTLCRAVAGEIESLR